MGDVDTFAELVAWIIAVINAVIPILGGIALVAFLINIVRFIWESREGHIDAERRNTILLSLVALFVLFSIWGILRLLLYSFFPGDFPSYAPPAPPEDGNF